MSMLMGSVNSANKFKVFSIGGDFLFVRNQCNLRIEGGGRRLKEVF